MSRPRFRFRPVAFALIWALACGASNASQAVGLNTGVDALAPLSARDAGPGTNGTATLCSNGPTVQLIDYLNGDPDPGGTWVGPGGAHSGSFIPGTDPVGNYVYTQGGGSATVAVTVNTLPVAGGPGGRSVCSNEDPFQLITVLTGSPQNSGAWTGPGGGPVSGTFTPGTSVAGAYTYTVSGSAPCPSVTAVATITQTAAPNAGGAQTISVCSSESPFAMTTRLTGSPAAGGTWTGPMGAHGPTFNPLTDPPGNYTYTVTGTAPCANATAVLTIQLTTAPVAGGNGSVPLCSTDGQFQLFTALTGAPDVGGTWRNPSNAVHSGAFIPGTDPAGVYTYTVAGQSPCTPVSATVTVTVNQAPNAGVGGAASFCSDDPNVNLFLLLTGNPTSGGTWTGPPGATGTFDPGVSTPGAYTYTVNGVAPCTNATATINVSVTDAPDAGGNGTANVCSIDPPFNLFPLLTGDPDANGTWTLPAGGASNGEFTPGTSPPGAYTYTVPGTGPCDDATATVTVSVVNAPNPGANNSITRCSSDGSVNLFTVLLGTPQVGGTWTRPDGSAHSGTYLPGTQLGGNYTYTVQGTGPCNARSAVVQVTRIVAPNAGVDGSITVCSSNGSFPLIDVLSGNPGGSGTWRTPTGGAFNGTFVPGTSVAGRYAYVIPGTAPCINDSGFVTVTVNPAPNAGANANITVCSSDAAFPLFGRLNGTPDPGGTWTDPNGMAHNGTFTPGTSIPGGYTYTRTGLTPCLPVSAVVVVNVNRRPRAGANGTFTRCSTDGAVNLFTQLGGTPDAGGVWTGPGPVPGGIFLPGSSTAGTYTYTVAGTAPCVNATATVVAVVNGAPNAGVGSTITICQGATSVNLFTGLTGTPDMSGTWTELTSSGNLSGNIFSPGALPPGNYDFRYTVTGGLPCGNATSTVRVTIVPSLNAGTNGTLPACGSNAAVNLFTGLGGGPQQGGTWIDLGSTGALNGQNFNATLVTAGTYLFRYRLTGVAGCPSDSAQVTVNVTAPPNAGTSGSTTACSNGGQFPLIGLLGPNAQANGVWRTGGPTGPIVASNYNPSTDDPNVFTYVVNAALPCTAVFATVTVTEERAPNAGDPESISVCSNSAEFDMRDELGGTPDAGGQWWFMGQNHGPLFVPGLDSQGVYEYRVQGVNVCPQATSTLTVSVVSAANAGQNSSVTYCTGGGAQLMFDALTGSPNNGGFWLRPDLTVRPSGSFNPLTDVPGDYRYVITGTSPCVNDTAVLSVFVDPSPNAGDPASASICSSAPSVNLFTFLTGSPDQFGTWVGPAPTNPTFSGLFIPGTSLPGIYRYRVSNSCGADSATVTVSIGAPANAGCPATISVCESAGAFSMIGRLGCNPANGGVWTGPLPSMAQVDGVFTPGTSVAGTYRYSIMGTGSCPVATSTLTITVDPRRSAGVDNSRFLCRTDGQLQLFPLLGPTAQPGGIWKLNGVQVPATIQPATDQSGTYVYFLAGSSSCPADSALVDITIYPQPNAGDDGIVTVCTSAPLFTLDTSLNGTPQLGGAWYAPGSPVPFGGIFNPATMSGGAYKYLVMGNAGCPADSAYVTVILNQLVDAGENGQIQVCSDDPPFQLFSELTGTPQAGGTWFDPDGLAIAGSYTPGLSQPGVYKYRRIAIAPCTNDSATVTVFENRAPDAGISALVSICSGSGQVALLDLLEGDPDSNGSWTFNGDEHGPFFDPSTDLSGTYVHTVSGLPPCGVATAQVVIDLIQRPSAGSNGAATVCLGTTDVDLFAALGGNPTNGGTWTTTCGQGTLTNGVFNTTGMSAGTSCTFTYTQPALGPCSGSSATVVVSVVAALNAGQDVVTDACRPEVLVLFGELGGTPQEGGSWRNVDSAPGFIAGVFNTGTVPANTNWRFQYILPGTTQCPSDTAQVTVQVQDGPNAGGNGSLGVCDNATTPVSLGSGLTGTPDGTGSWLDPALMPHSELFDPAVDVAGIYRYVVPGIGACPSDTAQVLMNVSVGPFAGESITLNICSTDPEVDMFTLLGPDAQTPGTWITVSTQTNHSSIYNPVIDVSNTFRYRVAGTPPCGPSDAFVTIVENPAAFAGQDAAVDLCSGGVVVQMRPLLGGSAMSTGTWVYVTGGNVPHGNSFDPGMDLPGVYRYTVPALAPCEADTAFLTIGVIDQGDPGNDGSIEVCASETAVDLFVALGPDAEVGGAWTDVDGSEALTDNLFNASVAGNGTWRFRYGFPAVSPCAAAFATVTVTVGSGGNAGEDSTVTICGGNQFYNLFLALAGTPTPGGDWSAPSGGDIALIPGGYVNGQLLPIDGATDFVYTFDSEGCGVTTAVVRVTATDYPNAGGDTTIARCSTDDDPMDLFAQLSGDPDTTGFWMVYNFGTDSIFDPDDPPGTYSYIVPGIEPCAADTARVIVSVSFPPNVGMDGEATVCSTDSLYTLLDGLEGNPTNFGLWTSEEDLGFNLGVFNLDPRGLDLGDYHLTYTLQGFGCPDDSSSLLLHIIDSPSLADTFAICNTQDRTYVVIFTMAGDGGGGFSVEGLSGTLTDSEPYVFTSDPIFTSQLYEAVVQDEYACGPLIVTGGTPCAFDADVFLPESFSPNGDGVNELFLIPGIEGYPTNQISIFNRWGGKIFDAAGYDNNEVVWDGSSPNAVIGGNAPAGTYFYVLDLGDGNDPYTGFIQLVR